MLLIEATIVKDCPAGANVAEIQKVGTQPGENAGGRKVVLPIWASVYVAGMPFAVGSPPCLALVALKSGDTIRATDETDHVHQLWDVRRGGELFWNNEALADEVERAHARRVAAYR